MELLRRQRRLARQPAIGMADQRTIASQRTRQRRALPSIPATTDPVEGRKCLTYST
jgi:hypothetical protein